MAASPAIEKFMVGFKDRFQLTVESNLISPLGFLYFAL